MNADRDMDLAGRRSTPLDPFLNRARLSTVGWRLKRSLRSESHRYHIRSKHPHSRDSRCSDTRSDSSRHQISRRHREQLSSRLCPVPSGSLEALPDNSPPCKSHCTIPTHCRPYRKARSNSALRRQLDRGPLGLAARFSAAASACLSSGGAPRGAG